MNIIPYFFQKLGKILQNLSSAAVVIGALRVKYMYVEMFSGPLHKSCQLIPGVQTGHTPGINSPHRFTMGKT